MTALVGALRIGSGATLAASAASPAPVGALPDVVGLRPGIPAQQAYDFLKAYDRIAQVFVSDTPVAAPGQSPVTQKPAPFAIAMTQDPNGAAELIQADLTLPPSKPTVWRVARRVRFTDDQQPTTGNMIASLRKKYGAEDYLMQGQNPVLTWYFNEQGGRALPPDGVSPANCAAILGPGTVLAAAPAVHAQQFLLFQPLPDHPQVSCRTLVVVRAQLSSGSTAGRILQLEVVVVDAVTGARACRHAGAAGEWRSRAAEAAGRAGTRRGAAKTLSWMRARSLFVESPRVAPSRRGHSAVFLGKLRRWAGRETPAPQTRPAVRCAR